MELDHEFDPSAFELRSRGLIQGFSKKELSMSQAAISCPKCQGEMAQGYVHDFTPVGVGISQWNAGPPKKAFSAGILDAPSHIPIGTFRCQSCGFLESYAREEVAAK